MYVLLIFEKQLGVGHDHLKKQKIVLTIKFKPMGIGWGCEGIYGGSKKWKLPLKDVRRVKAHDLKLWKCDEVCAHVVQVERYFCPCRICPGAHPLKWSTIFKHLQDFGRHPHNRKWIEAWWPYICWLITICLWSICGLGKIMINTTYINCICITTLRCMKECN